MSGNFGQDGSQILNNFRQFTKSYIEQFLAEKNRVFKLLGLAQQYSSGIFREGLLRSFLRKILPNSVSISSGFIYGFEVEKNSQQIDIIIWDSSKYGVIFSIDEFVIVPPESVIAIITVKSHMRKSDLENGLKNLSSVIDIDLKFRRSRLNKKDGESIFNPIYKYFISYKKPTNIKATGEIISNFYIDLIRKNQSYTNDIFNEFNMMDPLKPADKTIKVMSTYIPNMIFSLDNSDDNSDASFISGFGPPEENMLQDNNYGPEKLKRIPYLYKQNNNITTQLDKFVAELLQVVYEYLGTPGWSTPAAWADIHPVTGFRSGDSYEIDKTKSWPLIDYRNSKIIYSQKNSSIPDAWN